MEEKGRRGAGAENVREKRTGEDEEGIAFIEDTKAVMAEAEAALGSEVSRRDAETQRRRETTWTCGSICSAG